MRNGEREGHKVLIRRSAIEKRVKAVARQITRDYKGQRIHLIGVLKGRMFLSRGSCAGNRSGDVH